MGLWDKAKQLIEKTVTNEPGGSNNGLGKVTDEDHKNAEIIFLRYRPCLLSDPLVVTGGGRERCYERRSTGEFHGVRNHEELSERWKRAVYSLLPRP